MDLTDVVRMRPELDWLDIFLGFREHVTVYDNRIFMFPLDGGKKQKYVYIVVNCTIGF